MTREDLVARFRSLTESAGENGVDLSAYRQAAAGQPCERHARVNDSAKSRFNLGRMLFSRRQLGVVVLSTSGEKNAKWQDIQY